MFLGKSWMLVAYSTLSTDNGDDGALDDDDDDADASFFDDVDCVGGGLGKLFLFGDEEDDDDDGDDDDDDDGTAGASRGLFGVWDGGAAVDKIDRFFIADESENCSGGVADDCRRRSAFSIFI